MIGPQEAPIQVPDFPEYLTGWRCWVVGGDGEVPLLRSVWASATWPPRTYDRDFITAICRLEGTLQKPPAHECPSPDKGHHGGVGCGIYAYRDIPSLAWDFPMSGLPCLNPHPSRWAKSTIPLIVWGKVGFWGKVYPHEHGWRAQFARIESIAFVEGANHITLDMAEWLAEAYGVPVLSLKAEDLSPGITEAHRVRLTHERFMQANVWTVALRMGTEAINTAFSIIGFVGGFFKHG